MTDERESSERARIAADLRRVRDEVRARALHEKEPPVLGAPLAPRVPTPMPEDPAPLAAGPPRRPDSSALNELWPLIPALQGGGWRRAVARKLSRLLARVVETQERFNARQVQFDNEILDYIDARFDVTHRHYDSVLGIHSRHMAEIDERHLIVQEELVSHVHDLVKRIDLVLARSEKGRLGLEFALQDVRARLLALEERISRG